MANKNTKKETVKSASKPKTTEKATKGVAETQVCKGKMHVGTKPLALNAENFSPLEKGGFSDICKPCRVVISNEWTSRPEIKAMREVQTTARKYQGLGIPVLVPSAKGFDASAPLMTIPHYTDKTTGELLPDADENTKNTVFHPAVEAKPLYDAIIADRKATKDAERDAKKADADKAKETAKAERKAEREKKATAKALEAKQKADAKKADVLKKATANALANTVGKPTVTATAPTAKAATATA